MPKCNDAALSGKEMQELYYKNKEDKSFDNPENLHILLAYQSEQIADGVTFDTDVLEFCTDRLFRYEKHREPDRARLHKKFTVIGVIMTVFLGGTIATSVVCSAFGLNLFANIFTHEVEKTVLNVVEEYTGAWNEDDTSAEEEVTGTGGVATLLTEEELIETGQPGWLPDGYELLDATLYSIADYYMGYLCYTNGEGQDICVFVSDKTDSL